MFHAWVIPFQGLRFSPDPYFSSILISLFLSFLLPPADGEVDLACSSVLIVEGGRVSIIFLFDDQERRHVTLQLCPVMSTRRLPRRRLLMWRRVTSRRNRSTRGHSIESHAARHDLWVLYSILAWRNDSDQIMGTKFSSCSLLNTRTIAWYLVLRCRLVLKFYFWLFRRCLPVCRVSWTIVRTVQYSIFLRQSIVSCYYGFFHFVLLRCGNF